MKRLLPILAALILFASCELFLPEPERATVHTVSIGIDYQNISDAQGFRISKLKGTVPDAKELFFTFRNLVRQTNNRWEGYLLVQEDSGYDFDRDEDVVMEADEDGSSGKIYYASRERLFSTLETIAGSAQVSDLTIITYSGHGLDNTGELVLAHTKPDGNIGKLKDAEVLVSPNELLEAITTIPGRKLLILDSCYSGRFVPLSESSSSTIIGGGIPEWYEKYWAETTIDKTDLYVISASALSDSYEENFGTQTPHHHGIFTYTLLEALGLSHPHPDSPATLQFPRAIKNSTITVDSLYTYIKENQGYPLKSSIFTNFGLFQHPLVSGGALDMVLFRF